MTRMNNYPLRFPLAVILCLSGAAYAAEGGRPDKTGAGAAISISSGTGASPAKPFPGDELNARGLSNYRQGRYDDAIKDFTKAAGLGPHTAAYLANRGMAYNDKKEYDRALKDLDAAIKLDPKLASAYVCRGYSYMYTGEAEKAKKDWDKAILLDPRSDTAYGNRAEYHLIAGDYDAAITDCEKAAALAPAKNYYSICAKAYRGRGDHNKAALASYDHLLLHPAETTSYMDLHWTYYRQGDVQKALENCGRAAKLDAGLPNFARWFIYARKGDYARAEQYCRTTAQGPGCRATDYYEIGAFYESRKQYAEALWAYKKAALDTGDYAGRAKTAREPFRSLAPSAPMWYARYLPGEAGARAKRYKPLERISPFSEMYAGNRAFSLNSHAHTDGVILGGTGFEGGIGVEANSSLIYALDGRYEHFEGSVGLAAAAKGFYKDQKVRFLIFADEKPVFESPEMAAGEPAVKVSLDLAGKRTLVLETRGPIGIGPDPRLAFWAEAGLYTAKDTGRKAAKPIIGGYDGIGGPGKTDTSGVSAPAPAEITRLIAFITGTPFPLSSSLVICRNGPAAAADLTADLKRIAGGSGDAGTAMVSTAKPVSSRAYRIDKLTHVLRADKPDVRPFMGTLGKARVTGADRREIQAFLDDKAGKPGDILVIVKKGRDVAATPDRNELMATEDDPFFREVDLAMRKSNSPELNLLPELKKITSGKALVECAMQNLDNHITHTYYFIARLK